MDGSLNFEADGPTIIAVRVPNGGKALQRTGGARIRALFSTIKFINKQLIYKHCS
jgi:hypothetical protein